MASMAVTAFSGFFFWVVVARFYTESEVGYSSAIISAAGFLAALSLLGLDFSLIRFLPRAENPQKLLNSSFTLSGLVSLVTASIFLVSVDYWSPVLDFIKGNAIFSAVFIVLTLILTLSPLVSTAFIARRRAIFVLLQCSTHSFIKIPLPLLFVLFFHAFGIVASWSIAFGVSLAVSLFLFLPRVQRHYKPVPTLNLSSIKGMWQYSAGTYLTSLFTTAPTTILPLMVVNLLGPVQNAYFYIAWMMSTALFAIPLGVSHSLFAEGSHFDDKLREHVTKSLKFNFLLLIPAAILLILIGKWLLLVFGQSYSLNALTLLRILAISSLPLSINYIYISILRVTHRMRELMIIWAFIAVATLVTSYLVLPSIGIIGTGYAWFGIHSAIAIYGLISIKRRRLI